MGRIIVNLDYLLISNLLDQLKKELDRAAKNKINICNDTDCPNRIITLKQEEACKS